MLRVSGTMQHDTSFVLFLTRIADEYDERGEYEKAISLCKQAQRTADSLHYKVGLQSALNRMGNCYIDQGDVKKALECHLQVLKIREEIGSKRGIGYSWLNLGNIYFRLKDDDNSLKSYAQALTILQQAGDSTGVATCLGNMGAIFSNRQETQKAEEHYLRSLELRKRMGNTEGVAETYSNLSIVFMDGQKYKQALFYSFKAVELYGEARNKLGKAISYSNIGDIYEHMNEYNNAVNYQLIALAMAREMNSQYMMQMCYQLLGVAYQKKNDYKNALYYSELYSHLTDSMMNSENSKLITEMQARFETEKKEKEIELLQKDQNIRELRISQQQADLNRQRIVIYSFIGGFALILGLVFFIWKSYREKKRINTGLEKKNTEIQAGKKQIEEKNGLITDSIDYARSIQKAILPSDQLIRQHFPDSFILFLPKDIVSGDFYWLHTGRQEKTWFATVDCTGHGVPGAFMSVMAYNMLENILAEKKFSSPALVLDELNRLVLDTFHQESVSTSAKYGMDISLIALDKKKGKLEFAGAHNSLCLVREQKLSEFKANNATIGMAREKFTNHALELQKGDTLYLFTDGYPDQKGGPENKKLFISEFKDSLVELALKNMPQQKETLYKTLTDWRRGHEQIDDILVAGIRF